MASLYSRGNSLSVRLPDKLGLGRYKFISLGLPANAEGIGRAIQIVNDLNRDIIYDRFDFTLEKYLPTAAITEPPIDLYELWCKYCDYKEGKVRESTLEYLRVTIGSKIRLIPILDITKSAAISKWVISHNTKDYGIRVLAKISALYEWSILHELINSKEALNPYKGHLDKARSNVIDIDEEPDEARPLSDSEVNSLITGIRPVFRNFVKYCFLTGCRPSEGIGLEWRDVREDHLFLGRTLRCKNGKVFMSPKSKNNRNWLFPKTEELADLLDKTPKLSDQWVFAQDKPKIQYLSYDSYYKNWKKIMPEETSPYNTRDTFISRQISLGMPPAVVAKWVDNSVRVIEKHYLKIGLDVVPYSLPAL
jgi:integrase